MPKQFLTVKEVAKLMGVTPLTIRNWDLRGKLTAYRHPVNNYRLYKNEDIEKMMKEIEDSYGQRPAPRVQVEPEKPQAKKLKIDIL